jgi:hypothetical protein
LDTGIVRASSAIQKRARQSQYRIGTTGRFDPRLEIADVQVFDGIVITGTNTVINDRMIIEGISINISDGNYSQSISGRRDVDNVGLY